MPAAGIAGLFARLSSERNGNGDRVYAEAGGVHRLDLRGGLSPGQTALLRDAAGALLRGLAEGTRERSRAEAEAASGMAARFAATLKAPGPELDQVQVAALAVAVFGLVSEHHPRVAFEVHTVDPRHWTGAAPAPVSGGGGGGGGGGAAPATKAGFKRAVMRRAGIMEDLKALALSKGIRSYTTKENLVDGILRKARVAELRRFLRDHPAPGA